MEIYSLTSPEGAQQFSLFSVFITVLSCCMCFQEMGLLAGTPVGTSLIDAHAGGVGVMESKLVSDPKSNGSCYLLMNSGFGFLDLIFFLM